MSNALNRRDFLKLGSGAVAATALPTTNLLGADAPAKNRPIRKAVM